MADYKGDDEALELRLEKPPEPDVIFEVRPPNVPAAAIPVYDEELGAVVGYRHEEMAGIYRLYDVGGNLVGVQEKGLDQPLLDPLDLFFFAGGILRAIGKGVLTGITRTAPKVAALAARGISSGVLMSTVVGAMRAAFKGLSVGALKFTATTGERMAVRGRYVPLHILHLAIKYGKRTADPQGVTGAFLYTTKLFRNGKEYALEVVVRESDWTILHFLYK